MRGAGSGRSLRRRLLWVMIITLSAVAIGLGAVGTILIDRIVEQSFDKLLGAAVKEIADTVVLQRGEISFDIPPPALGKLENEQRDSVYYSVRNGGQLLTGYGELPALYTAGARVDERVFGYAEFNGRQVRMAAELRQLPKVADPVVVQVAQTLDERRSLTLVMRTALYLLELSFVVVAALLVWPTLKWSLRPVNRIREELDARPADHANFAPLDLRLAPTELVGLVGGFNHLLERLEAAVAGMRQFTADASHQMRTPLAVLRTHLAVLSGHASPGSVDESALQDVHGAVTRLESLLTRLVTLAHADEAVRRGIERSEVDLRSVITQVVGELMPLAVERDISLAVNAEQRPFLAHAEPVLVAEILTNLLDNAIRYNRPGGAVCIGVEQSSHAVTMSVEDDGPGIPAAEHKHVFERFYRLPRDQAQSGSGLGLPIVKTLSEALRAQIDIATPTAGHGLIVSVAFEPFVAQTPQSPRVRSTLPG